MVFGKGREPDFEIIEEIIEDPTGWMIDNSLAHVFLLHQFSIKLMFMLGYTFYTGTKVFKTYGDKPVSFKFVMMVLACTGGGLITPLLINSMPVIISNDSYAVTILITFSLHHYFPVLRDVVDHSNILKVLTTLMYQVTRAYVVVLFTGTSAAKIPASLFPFPVFGPIFCGAISGVGGMFMPLNKGLDPIKEGLDYNMITAIIAASAYHIFISTSLSEGCIDAKDKAHIHITMLFVAVGLVHALGYVPASNAVTKKKEE